MAIWFFRLINIPKYNKKRATKMNSSFNLFQEILMMPFST